MFDKMREVINKKYGYVSYSDFEEGSHCYYIRFIHNSTFMIARLSKISKRLDIFKAEESIYVD